MNAQKGALRDSMEKERAGRKRNKAQSRAQIRATISFPPDIYESLEGIAREKKVSIAWVVREAAESYIANKWPLLAELGKERL